MDDFEKMLIDVRNSFRLLYHYNKRILDLMNYIGKKFNINYKGGYPKFSNSSPNNGKGKLDNWAWDWLNLYFYEFHFEKKNIMFSIILQSDTGMWDANVKKTDVEKFEKASKSKTKLIFLFKKSKDWDLEEFFNSNNLKGKYIKTFEISDNKKNIYCMVFNINEFKNKTETDKSLKKFIKYLNDNEIYDIKFIDEEYLRKANQNEIE